MNKRMPLINEKLKTLKQKKKEKWQLGAMVCPSHNLRDESEIVMFALSPTQNHRYSDCKENT